MADRGILEAAQRGRLASNPDAWTRLLRTGDQGVEPRRLRLTGRWSRQRLR